MAERTLLLRGMGKVLRERLVAHMLQHSKNCCLLSLKLNIHISDSLHVSLSGPTEIYINLGLNWLTNSFADRGVAHDTEIAAKSLCWYETTINYSRALSSIHTMTVL